MTRSVKIWFILRKETRIRSIIPTESLIEVRRDSKMEWQGVLMIGVPVSGRLLRDMKELESFRIDGIRLVDLTGVVIDFFLIFL